jgi:hypothetical protein
MIRWIAGGIALLLGFLGGMLADNFESLSQRGRDRVMIALIFFCGVGILAFVLTLIYMVLV